MSGDARTEDQAKTRSRKQAGSRLKLCSEFMAGDRGKTSKGKRRRDSVSGDAGGVDEIMIFFDHSQVLREKRE